VPLFAFDANPAIDGPLVFKSHSEMMELLRTGQASVLRNARGKEWAIQFTRLLAVEHTLASQLAGVLASSDIGEQSADQLLQVLEHSRSGDSGTSISDRESKANVGDADTPAAILRARVKLKAWPLVGDEKALRIRCKS